MRRREFIAGIGATAMMQPFAARAQQDDKTRRVGVLSLQVESDPLQQRWDRAFRQRLGELGWTDGRNIHIDYRFADGSVDRLSALARELIALKPDALFGVTTPPTAVLQNETKTIPIIFAVVSDPVGSGFVASLSKPGGNITGFINIEGSVAGKWVELMHDVAPSVSRVGILYNPETARYAKVYVDAFRTAAAALSIAPVEAPIHSVAEVEAFLTKFGSEASSGVVVIPDTFNVVNRQPIIALAKQFHLPAIYPFDFFVSDGGLMSYGINNDDLFRGAATYVDRVLKGAKPSELAVQLPTKFDLAVNLKTAKALGLAVPEKLLAIADEVIE